MSEDLEIWKDISGYEGVYQASTLGRIRSFAKLNNRSVQIIRYMVNELKFTLEHSGNMFGVQKAAVFSIIKGKTWKHLPTDYSGIN